MKPLTYWADSKTTQQLSDEFGACLENLTTREKISILSIVAFWVRANNQLKTFSLKDAFNYMEGMWADCKLSEYGMCSEEAMKAIDILNEVENRWGTTLVIALAYQVQGDT
jgi:hypothetical protein